MSRRQFLSRTRVAAAATATLAAPAIAQCSPPARSPPGWREPSSQFSFFVSADEWAKLPRTYQEAFAVAAGVTLHRYPTDILRAAQKIALDMYEEEAGKNAAFRKICTSWKKHREDSYAWFSVAEQGYENFAYARG